MSFDLNNLFNSIQLSELLAPDHRLNEKVMTFLQFIQFDSRHQEYIDKLSYRAFIHNEIQANDVGPTPRKTVKPFRSFLEFTQLLKSTFESNQFQNAATRSLIEHRILATQGAIYYQILAYLQKCTLMYEIVMSHADEIQQVREDDINNSPSSTNLFFNTPSRIPVAQRRAEVLQALGNPELTNSKRDRLQWAYDATV